MLPAAALIYVVSFVIADEMWRRREATDFLLAGLFSAAFIVAYWLMLWRGAVQWTRQRVVHTVVSAVAALLVGLAFGAVLELMMRGSNGTFGTFIATSTAPIIWLILTVFAWRETPGERLDRLGSIQKSAIVCPTCGYNLTGLTATRCPECGRQFTLDELLSAQPHRADRAVEE